MKHLPKSFILFGGNTIGIAKSFKTGTMCDTELFNEFQDEIELLWGKINAHRQGFYCCHCDNPKNLCTCQLH